MNSDSLLDVGAVVAETYRIEGLIGRGGMGAVWAAEHLRLPGRHVAVKVLLDAAAGGEEMLQRFRREAEIASRLGHPNIVEVLDFNLLPTGQPYIVLEYLQGETLAARLVGGRLPLEEALAISRQIGSALQAAHRAGVVHRDLKPENVFLCTPEEDMPTRVKVLDFGISKIRGSQSLRTQDAILMGTPQYMSPEQATGRNATVDGRTDVFALGAIVYEMLGGQPAFAGGSLAEVVSRVVHGQPTPLRELAPALPANVLAAVDRALEKDPAARFQDIGSFILELTGRPLHTFSTGQPRGLDSGLGHSLDPTHTPQPGGARTTPYRAGPGASAREAVRSGAQTVPPSLPTPSPRRIWLVGVLVGALGLTAGGLGVAWTSRRPPAPAQVARSDRLEPEKPIEAPPPPPVLRTEPAVGTPEASTTREPAAAEARSGEATTHAPAVHEKPPTRRALHRGHPEPTKPAETVASAEQPRTAEPPPQAPSADGMNGEVRKLLDQAEDALTKNRPLDAARLVDQSFFIQKTPLGYAIQVRAACQRRDLGAARAAFRNLADPQLKQLALRACVRQGVWLF